MNSSGIITEEDKKLKALWEAIIKSDLATVESIVINSPDIINKPFGDYANFQISLQDGPYDIIQPTPLQVAANFAYSNNPDFSIKIDIVNLLFANRAEVNAKSRNGVTALHLAASRANAPLFTILTNHKANLDARDDKNLSPFHYALKSESYHTALTGHQFKIKGTFTRGNCDPNTPETDSLSPLHYAVTSNNKEMVEHILRLKVNVNRVDRNGKTALQIAAQANNLAIAQKLVEANAYITPDVATAMPSLLNGESYKDYQLGVFLIEAIRTNNTVVVDNLIRFKADVNRVDRNGQIPLQIAAQANNLALAQKLVDANAYITPDVAIAMPGLLKGQSYNDYQLGVLIEAVSTKNYSLIDCIIKTGIEVSVLLHLGMGNPTNTVSMMVLEELFNRNLDPNILDPAGNTLIEHLYFNSNSKDGYNLLAKYSAYIPNVVAQTISPFDYATHQFNALKVAIKHNNSKVIDLILKELHADVIFIAVENGDLQIVDMLLEHDVDVKVKDNYGRTPYELATHKSYWDIVSLLVEKHGKSILPESNLSSNYKNDGTLNSIIQHGRALMKNQRYAEAEKIFSIAIIKYNEGQDKDENLLRKLRYWHLKSMDLKHIKPSPILPPALLQPVEVIVTRITAPTDMQNKLSAVKDNKILAPFLTYLAYNFMFNERATIRVMGTCATKEKDHPNYAGVYLSHSTVQISNSLNTVWMTGNLMHELTHYYFDKRYHNLSEPYGINQADRKAIFAKTKKDVLKNIAKYLSENLGSKPVFNITEEMTSYQLGTELNKYVTDHKDEWNEIEKKHKEMADAIMKFLWMYDKNSAYSEDVEDVEFPVRLLELIAEQASKEVLDLFEPLVKHYEDYFIPDCLEANKKLAEMAEKLYTPPQYSYPPQVFEMALGVGESVDKIHCFSWNMDHETENSNQKKPETQKLLSAQLTEVLHTITNLMQSKNPLDVITIQNIDPLRVEYIRDRLNTINPNEKWVHFDSNGVITFVNTARVIVPRTMTAVDSQGIAVQLKKNDSTFRLINTVNPEVYISIKDGEALVNEQFKLSQIKNLFNQVFHSKNITAELVIKQTVPHVLLTNVVFSTNEEAEWLKPFKTAKPTEYLIPADSLLFKQLQMDLDSNNAQASPPSYEIAETKSFGIFRPDLQTPKDEITTVAISQFKMQLSDILSNSISSGTQLFDNAKTELQKCVEQLIIIVSDKGSLSTKSNDMLAYLNKTNLTEEHQRMIKGFITQLQENSEPQENLEVRKV